jgi:methanogenic corrinoid protein MtbC1
MAIAALEDYHLLGKRIVYSLLRASGFELKDYGRVDVPALIRQVREDRIEMLLISVLMLPSALRIKEVKAGLAGMEWPIRLIVGGAPFRLDDLLWKEVGADATSPDASGVIPIVTQYSLELLSPTGDRLKAEL